MKEFFDKYGSIVSERLNTLLGANEIPKKLSEAMRYSIFAGGKRLRPMLTLAGNLLKNNNIDECLDIACAMEMIHTYSLIHDDLPAMDNDSMRRGKPSCHMAFGEGLAILAGDALLNLAFETMINNALKFPENTQNHLNVIAYVAKSSGALGMIGGQAVDTEFEGKVSSPEELAYIHEHKTAALIRASLLSGLLINSPTDEEITCLEKYGSKTGLVFQIIDDILDETGDSKLVGKTLKKDGDKLTYVKVYGVEKSMELAQKYTNEAKESLNVFENNNEAAAMLYNLAEFLLNRNN